MAFNSEPGEYLGKKFASPITSRVSFLLEKIEGDKGKARSKRQEKARFTWAFKHAAAAYSIPRWYLPHMEILVKERLEKQIPLFKEGHPAITVEGNRDNRPPMVQVARHFGDRGSLSRLGRYGAVIKRQIAALDRDHKRGD